MIVNDLLVTGSGRFVDKVYANEFEGDLAGHAETASVTTELGTQPQLTSKSAMDGFLSGTGVRYATFNTPESGTGFQSNDGMILSLPWANSTAYGAQIAFDDAKVTNVAIRGKGETWGDWYRLLHTGNWSSHITNVASATKIHKTVSLSSSTNNYAGKYIKFATIDISSGAWNSCAGTLIFNPLESASGCKGVLNLFIRTNSTISEYAGNLVWLSLADSAHADSVVAVNTADGKFDLYFKATYTYETPEITGIFYSDESNITLTNGGTYVDGSSLTFKYVSSIKNVSSSCTGNAASATTVDKIKQNASNASYGRPILLAYDANPTDGSYGLAYYDSGVTVNPSTNTITADTFAGYATKNTKHIDISGQCQLTAYRKTVIALCLAPTTANSNLNSYSSGRITMQRTNALYAPMIADISIAAAYGAIGQIRTRFIRNNGFQIFKPCVFTYNGVKYGGIEVKTSDAEASKVTFDGTTTFNIFALDYYDTNASSVLNQEVYDSITYDTVVIEKGWYDGDNEFITTYNIGSQSVSSATKATQDASGNTITSTYATKTELNNKSKVQIVRW